MSTRFQRGDHVVNVTPGTDQYQSSFVVEDVYLHQTAIGRTEERLILLGRDNGGRRGPRTGFSAQYYERLDLVKKQNAARRLSEKIIEERLGDD